MHGVGQPLNLPAEEEIAVKAMPDTEYGEPDVPSLQEVADPVPRDDDVLIEVEAAGVNWADWSMVTGMLYLMRLGHGRRRPRKGFRGIDVEPFLSLGKKEDLRQLVNWIEAGQLRVVVGRTYPLVETAEAVAYVGEGHAHGKTVITI